MSETLIDTDVCILGGGMAGLTLARQLKQARPELDLTVLEHRQFPVADATHKVGESTVEVASHYLANELGLAAHLESMQLPKFGLRLFLRGAEPVTGDLAQYDEIGASRVLPIPTYQLDRGRFENHLADVCRADGVRLLDGVTVRDVDLARGAHKVALRSGEGESAFRARYLVDASGRRAWLRKGEDLGRSARHNNCAIWFRVDGALDVDSWSSDASWQARCHGSSRRLSTNHFTGPGYWLWLIPLSSGATSVGLVFDPKYLAMEQVRKHDKLLSWLQGEHPLVAARLRDLEPLDFHVMENYAVTSAQVFSDDGWMTTGDAGIFSDPLYSPGGDFIALANGYITELITSEQQDPAVFADFQGYFFSFFTSTLSLYRGQYGGFGNRDFMVAKTLWDYAYYWAVLSKLYFSGTYKDLAFMRAEQATLLQVAGLNSGMQKRFREVARQGARVGGEGRFFDHHAIPLFHSLKEDLLTGPTADAGASLRRNVAQLQRVAASVNALLDDHARGMAPPTLDRVAGFS
ncbi:MAG: NAD(P)/FAD-dependent oxidoreductase [Pseudomonadales bacterium]